MTTEGSKICYRQVMLLDNGNTMATRPVFVPLLIDQLGVQRRSLEFSWHPGFAKMQKQKSIAALHAVANRNSISPVLEISSKSMDAIGVELSAFNLCMTTQTTASAFTVETAFQGSKVFEKGGPYRDLIGMDSRAAKRELRLKESGSLVGFDFFGVKFPLVPRTYFYDWLYISALTQNEQLAKQLAPFKGFTDIEFNPAKSINCQAYAAALYLSLQAHHCLHEAIRSPERFLEITGRQYATQR